MITLAHLSDPHVSPLPSAAPARLLNKRLLGYLSWQKRRRRIHRADVLEALLDDLRRLHPDQIAVTGDLINLSLPDEYPLARQWLQRLGEPERVTVVPGNHDAYVPVAWARGCGLWQPYMRGDAQSAASPAHLRDFPQVRRRGPLALVGLSSARPTPPGLATGTLGARQLAALETVLEALAAEGRFRIVLLHHPPNPGRAWRKRLTDAAGFRAVIARAGAELVLHGHEHRLTQEQMPGPRGPVPVFGAPSASALSRDHAGAHYLLFHVARAETGWTVDVQPRRYRAETARFQDATARRRLDVAA